MSAKKPSSTTPAYKLLLPAEDLVEKQVTANPDDRIVLDIQKFIATLEISGKTYAVERDTRSSALLQDTQNPIEFFGSSAFARFILDKSSSTNDHSQLAKIHHWINVAETQFTSSTISSTLESIEKSNSFFPVTTASKALEAIMFVSLNRFSKLVEPSKFPKLAAWYNERASNVAWSKAILVTKQYVSTGPSVLPPPKVKESVLIKLDHHTRKVLPKPNERNILITSALPYVNNVPHLGNIIGCVLSADVFARYCRLRSYNTVYICGTDEYGTATETKALEEKLTCQQICDKYHALHKGVYEWFGIDFDMFGRTTTPKQTEIAQDIFKKLHDRKQLNEDTMTQLYCEKCSRFLADRYVEGTCPNCGYEDARGDQCDQCQKLLNAIDLVKPRCKMDGNTPIVKNSQHLFLDLPGLQSKNEEWFEESAVKGKWSKNGVEITRGLLKEGLKPRCITRDLKWGTPVPLESMKEKVFYVWFDAPIGYLSITANYTDEWRQWWKNPKNVELFQFMGKDNIPFHSIIFPCSLLGTGEDWTLVNHISTTEYLNYESGKFSKSRNVGVFGNNVRDSGIPVEVWRYYLLASRPESSDSTFLWKDFITKNNSELLANIGNFVNRIVKFINAKYDSVIPTYSVSGPAETKLIADVNALLKQYIDALEQVKLRQGLSLAMAISTLGNTYLQENRIDNNLFLNSRERCDTVVAVSVNLAYLISALLYPYMPTTTEGICRQLNLPARGLYDTWNGADIVAGHVIGKAEYLFKRIDEKMEEVFRAKYGGGSGAAGGNAAVAPADASKKAAVAAAAKGAKGKKASAPAPAGGIPDGVTKTPEMEALEVKIKEQGDLVRKLKGEKAAADQVKEAVNGLLELKANLQKLVDEASKK